MKLHKKLILLILTVIATITAIDYYRISNYETYPIKPNPPITTYENQIYYDLVNDKKDIDWERITPTLDYIQKQYDCSDFKLVNLIRILYEFEDSIPQNKKLAIDTTLFNFRYWMDEPDENSMCYWSENHQILFASAEYLIGQKYPTAMFNNSGLYGIEHKQKAQIRILDWLQMRWDYGFTEFYSEVYYKEDIAALINLIDFAKDKEIVTKSKIILDLLFYDVASQSSASMFSSTSGRAYERNRKGSTNTLKGLTNYYWGDGEKIGASIIYGMMVSKNYNLPPVLTKIINDTTNSIIKQSNGLDISELNNEGFNKTDTKSLMMQWGMEAFVNPLVVRNSLHHIREYNMFSNKFLADFKMLDFTLLSLLHLEPIALMFINPQYNGTAIQRGNSYTYRTKDYSLYTVQNYHVGDYADQHHIFGMNIGDSFSIFHSHPAIEKAVKQQSPNYWVGYGHLPHSVQYKNVNLSIYNIPNKKGIMERDLLDYTHAYFPKDMFDSVIINKNFIFAKKGDTYCAMIGVNNFNYRDSSTDDIIQQGKKVFWITEAGSKTEDGSFDDFIARIKSNNVGFDAETLVLNYHSNGNKYELLYNKYFKVNDTIKNSDYTRFDSPYVKTKRKPDSLHFECNGKSLFLDFEKMVRIF